ncbi:ureidoglycolate lyase [Phytopseudomonas dryadis]|uniref:Ureidoglycolate lyase n=1 Tax=Phytopseudomonas dryadis TaxID=2487520 RepID=A0A4Q9QY69_9GAMM|nr:ureidoglycolate lyase [Pseudomonas dryadis]TBU88813.1 ureidoglycolate lyase [Pseudomonas dryadis]
MRTLKIEPLTQAAFAPFGDVIDSQGRDFFLINNGSTRRYHQLASVQTSAPEDQAIISIFVAQGLPMPLTVCMLERHPLGSQAFMPLLGHPFLILVAPPGDTPDPQQARAFRSDGRQGVNYHRGVWHHPILALQAQDEFLVVDRRGAGDNCDEYFFDETQRLLLDPNQA